MIWERYETRTVQDTGCQRQRPHMPEYHEWLIRIKYPRAMHNKLVKLNTCIRDRGIFVQCDQRRVEQYCVHVFGDDTMVGCLNPWFVLIHYNGERKEREKREFKFWTKSLFKFSTNISKIRLKQSQSLFSMFSCKEWQIMAIDTSPISMGCLSYSPNGSIPVYYNTYPGKHPHLSGPGVLCCSCVFSVAAV